MAQDDAAKAHIGLPMKKCWRVADAKLTGPKRHDLHLFFNLFKKLIEFVERFSSRKIIVNLMIEKWSLIAEITSLNAISDFGMQAK